MPSGWRTDYTRYKEFFLNILRVYKTRPDIKSFLEVILSLTTILIFSLFAIKPTALTIIDLNTQIKNKQDTVEKLDQKLSNLKIADTLLEQQASSLSVVSQSIPQSAQVDKAIGQIQGFAQQSSVNILNISSSDVVLYGETIDSSKSKKDKEEKLPQDASQIPITVSASGSYQNLYNFLSTIEKLRRPIKIDSFAINSSTTENGVVLVMLITGRMPYLSE